MSYSIFDVVKDGPLTAPRWVHHLVKVAVHTAATMILASISNYLLMSALLGGPGLCGLIALREHFWPTDRQPLTRWQHEADWGTDCALATVPLVIALAVMRHVPAAIGLGGIVAVVYFLCHPDARP